MPWELIVYLSVLPCLAIIFSIDAAIREPDNIVPSCLEGLVLAVWWPVVATLGALICLVSALDWIGKRFS